MDTCSLFFKLFFMGTNNCIGYFISRYVLGIESSNMQSQLVAQLDEFISVRPTCSITIVDSQCNQPSQPTQGDPSTNERKKERSIIGILLMMMRRRGWNSSNSSSRLPLGFSLNAMSVSTHHTLIGGYSQLNGPSQSNVLSQFGHRFGYLLLYRLLTCSCIRNGQFLTIQRGKKRVIG